jgi:diguanylate cyclase (GGDEF)-like protein
MLSNQSIVAILLPAMIAGMIATFINWRIHRDMTGVGYWPGGTAVSVAGAFLRILEGTQPDALVLAFADALIIGGQFLMLYGLNRFAGRPMFIRTAIAVTVLAVIGTYYFTSVMPQPVGRTFVFSTALASTFLLQGPALLTLGRREGFTGVAVLAFVYAVGIVILGGRVVFMAIYGGLPSLDFNLDSLESPAQFGQILVVIYTTVLVTLRAYGYILLSSNRVQARLRQTATVDDLTGLPNRRAFEEEMRRITPRVRREGINFGLAVMDIDYFKHINDTHGHAAGDAMLRHFANVVRKVLRDSDFFARTGGEEFVLVVADTSAAALHQAAERIRVALEQSPLDLPAGPLHTTISGGLAVSQEGESNYQGLFARADAALYSAKTAGRNRVAPVA